MDVWISAADYFAQVLQARRELLACQNHLSRCEDLAQKTSMPISGLPRGSGGASRVEMVSISICDAETALRGKKTRLTAIRSHALAVIRKIPQENYRRLLAARYLDGMSWPQVSRVLGYSNRNSVYRAHGWALQEAQKVLDDMTT